MLPKRIRIPPWISARPRRGGPALEFALTLPILLLVLSATVDFGLRLQRTTAVRRVAADAARVGASISESQQSQGIAPILVANQHAQQSLAAAGIPCASGSCQIQSTLGEFGGVVVLTVRLQVAHNAFMPLRPPSSGWAKAQFTTITRSQPRTQ